MIDGILNVYKEKGFTSHDVVAKLRGILHQKKIGHTGTLDPEAEGVLPVCLGKATRLCGMLTDKTKIYRAGLLLGKETDTQDIWGKVVCEKKAAITEKEARRAVMEFEGTYAQIPPMYSALKVNGRKLYELARAGKVVEREPRIVTIFHMDIESVELPRIILKVCCSKGTYIRTLCHDIGKRLGCGGCMDFLVRLESGQFRAEDSLTLAQIEAWKEQGSLEQHIVSIEEVLRQYPAAAVLPESDKLVQNGNPLLPEKVIRLPDGMPGEGFGPGMKSGMLFRIYDSQGQFVGLYQWEQEKERLKPFKLFLGGR